MVNNIIGALLAFIVGAAVAFFNYLLSKQILLKHPDVFSSSAILRQIIQIIFLVTVYFIGINIPVNIWYLLIGAVLGVTLPLFYFTKRLLDLSASMSKPEEKEKKEGADNG